MKNKNFEVRVTKIEDLTSNIKEISTKCKSDCPDFKAGQFMLINVPTRPNSTITTPKPYSIASSPDDKGIFQFLIGNSHSGSASASFYQHLKVQDTLTMNGPWGNFYLRGGNKPALIIAGGSGMAPIRSMLLYIKNHLNSKPIHFFFGANSEYDMFYLNELEQLEKDILSFQFYPCVQKATNTWTGYKGNVIDIVKSDLSEDIIKNSQVYLCGPSGMVNAALEFFAEYNLDKQDIFYDKSG